MPSSAARPDPDRLRQFKAEFFKALAHPMRIAILELLRDGPRNVGEIQALTGTPGPSVSQQLAILRSRGIVRPERLGTTVRYYAADPQIYALLDTAREIFSGHLSDSAELLRLVEAEQVAAGG